MRYTQQLTYIVTAFALALIAGGWFFGMKWYEIRKEQVRNEAIVRCLEMAAQSGTEENPFNGAADQICMEDIGYPTIL
jgi:hypothetical protein